MAALRTCGSRREAGAVISNGLEGEELDGDPRPSPEAEG
jgi:hypothetical protein